MALYHRLGRAKSEQQIDKILAEAENKGLEKDVVVLQRAAERRTALKSTATSTP